MESVRLYLFKTEKLNFVNLLQYCFILSRRDLYQPCLPIIAGAEISAVKGQLVYDFSPDNPENFRNIEWESKIQLLDSILDSTNASIVLGSHDINQLILLKKNYQSKAYIISCSYTKNDYDLLLTYLVNTHLAMQSTGALPITEADQQLRATPSIDLLSYYKKSFDEQQLIPKSMVYPDSDYSVPLQEFFNKNKFFQHLINLDVDPSKEAMQYYDQWCKLQRSFFTLEPNI
jgi:hypothetical protein